MPHSQYCLSVIGLISCVLLYSNNSHAEENEVDKLRTQISQACPIAWEDYYSDITYQANSDIWQGNLADKVAYIKYASENLRTASGDFLIRNYSDPGSIIYVCGGLRFRFYELMHDKDSEIKAGIEQLSLFDNDQDGIDDVLDICNNTAPEAPVDLQGCSYEQRDDDLDGIANGVDVCANTDVSEVANQDGCAPSQRDTDSDGVNDHLDQCTDTSSTEQANSLGCAPTQIDSDADGTPDVQDAYPLQHDSLCLP